jgi:lipid A 3-O-deacylase
MRFPARLLSVLVMMAAPHGAAIAQSTHTLSLRIDNDAFDFWMLPWNRPDEEYTSGVHITYDGGRAPWWSRLLVGDKAACTRRVADCMTSRAELGQDIYTPAVSREDPHAAVGARPNAGWLFLSQASRSLREDRSDALTITLGVTGPPSLARFTQQAAHSMAPEFNRPTDWTRQIAFEPGAIVQYEQHRRVAALESGSLGFDLLPSMTLSAGNVLTAAEIGFQTRTGWNIEHPWLPHSNALGITLVSGLSARAVARDIFLDGNTIDKSTRVGHDPIVKSAEAGIELRYRALNLSYRAVSSTRAYGGGPKWHPWASIVGGVTFDR